MTNGSNSNGPRVALITGGGRRIGRAIGIALSRAGYVVVLHANRSRDDAEKVATDINAAGGRASVVLADLEDHDAVQGLVPAASAFGALTLLVNNAGVFEQDEIGNLARANFERAMAVNLTAPLFLAQAFAAQAPASANASIVNIVDQRVLKPTPLFFSYAISKAAPARAARWRLGRGPRPEDIAAAVLYLAQAPSVTGVTIAVDGGQHLAWRTADSDIAE